MCISPSGQCSVLIPKLKKIYDQKARDWKVLRLTIGLLDKTSFFINSADVSAHLIIDHQSIMKPRAENGSQMIKTP